MRLAVAAAITLVCISSCVSTELQVKSDDYGVAHELVATEYGDFNVYEHRSGTKFLVSSTVSDAAGQGVVKGLTFGGADTTPSEGAAQNAAEKYMAKHARVFGSCRIKNGYLVQAPVYEFILDCGAEGEIAKSKNTGFSRGSHKLKQPSSLSGVGPTGGITCDGDYSPYANRDRDGDGIECEWDDYSRSATPITRSTSRACFTGPRGGTYTITSGGKRNYGGC